MIQSQTVSLPLYGQSLVDGFLTDQQRLTAVERFSRLHESAEFPAQQKYYRDLIPLTKPAAGQQYSFEVDLDACTGCKSCVAACHTLNGLDENETWREVGLLVGGPLDDAIQQHVTTACHHCVEPACMEGCPVNAYEKDPVTGIVKHLDDQCIGCQYCVLKCPYDVPKYNKKKGIVRKCDMCSDRLEVGEAPACVQACPNEAIRIKIVDKQQVVEESEANVFLPGAPDPHYTHPTTNYKTDRALPRNMLPADYYSLKSQDAHFPLGIMLVLTQLSVGGFTVGRIVEQLGGEMFEKMRPVLALVSLALGLVALGASTLHLGRPMYAFRAVIGLRTSWLSREIVAFGLFAKLAAVYAAVSWFAPGLMGGKLINALSTAVVATGILGVVCSVMIYHSTQRVLWRGPRTTVRFILTGAVLGLGTTMLAGLIAAAASSDFTIPQFMQAWGGRLGSWLAIATTLKLLFELSALRHLTSKHHTPMKRTAMLMVGELKPKTLGRFAAGIVGGVLLPLVFTLPAAPTLHVAIIGVIVAAVFLLTIAGELLERYLFFTTVVAPKMPGGMP